MVSVKTFQLESFLPADYADGLLPRLHDAQRKLQEGTGRGSDFTGWGALTIN